MHFVVGRLPSGASSTQAFDVEGTAVGDRMQHADDASLARFVQGESAAAPAVRWVWDDTARWYPRLLRHGVRVARCHDLRLAHAILRLSTLTRGSALANAPRSAWDAAPALERPAATHTALFDVELDAPQTDADTPTEGADESVAEWRRQLVAVAGSAAPGRLRLLLAAESAGALIAAEMREAGLPWSIERHDEVLTEALGPRPPAGARPARMHELVLAIRAAVDDDQLNPDSPQELLRALRRSGINAASTSQWELREIKHPVIEPLLEYKKLARLLSANGWTWMEAWIVDGRFRPDYVPGGAATGRWATNGGGALQLPKQVRSAVRADPGWKLVVADAAQLEPRILAALSADTAMAAAGRGVDLYAGIQATGVVDTRAHAKVAMLGAMYGATTGESGRLLPRLARAYPRAIALVEEAARAGERGESVTSWLGRSSPLPPAAWFDVQSRASAPDASEADEKRARSSAREWGRFTRNFVVQSTAAEWALCWMAELRTTLLELSAEADPVSAAAGASGPLSGTVFAGRPHQVFFLHDEIVVHTPASLADAVAEQVLLAAEAAGRLLFGTFPVDFPLGAAIVDDYAEAK
ncbi:MULTISPECIES: bifunctional 3'-5' exonuclease/DNA polymerase [unclassified Leifsonia]|uniref:bifunctional 3'-5' exonuclease/DNA polymerase n=1 Tax=unclassified Leifsonia TaxID=2663824 RepID=UPI0006F248F3|nr:MULTISPECIES: bifunctional 3'-5' exonuclease/DNA polymerase [unclassified Leifsonia]KQX07058.1 3'-5' exonuclease [Leifsonia sp. Root1293]KRA11341.1 3'-5' exonuclease [Leifsonia sp. Root60]